MRIAYFPSLSRLFAMVLLAGMAGPMMTNGAKAQDQDNVPQQTGERESEQPGSDAWITAKVKLSLLAAKDTSGLALKVETVNGVVKLSGEVDSQAEAERDIAAARSVEGVVRVEGAGIKVRDGSAE